MANGASTFVMVPLIEEDLPLSIFGMVTRPRGSLTASYMYDILYFILSNTYATSVYPTAIF